PGLYAVARSAPCCPLLQVLWVNYLLPSQRERAFTYKVLAHRSHHDLLTFGQSQTYSPLVSPGSASSFAICSTCPPKIPSAGWLYSRFSWPSLLSVWSRGRRSEAPLLKTFLLITKTSKRRRFIR